MNKRKLSDPDAMVAARRVLGGDTISSVANQYGVSRATIVSSVQRLPDETREEIEGQVYDLKLNVRRAAMETIQKLLPCIDIDRFKELPPNVQAASLRDLARAIQSIETVPASIKIENKTQNNTVINNSVDVPAAIKSHEEWEKTVLRVTEKKPQ